MTGPFVRLLAISMAIVLCVSLALFGLRWMGRGQAFANFDHDLLNSKNYFVVEAGGSAWAPANSLAAFERTTKLFPQAWLEADLRLTKDSIWVLYDSPYLQTHTNSTGRIGDYTYEEIKNLDLGHQFKDEGGNFPFRGKGLRVLTAQEFLSRYAKHVVVLDLHDQSPNTISDLAAMVEKNLGNNSVVIQSPLASAIGQTKAQNPTWLFGESVRDLMKAQIMSALFIESLADLRGDILISQSDRPTIEERLIRELKRRHKKFVASTSDEANLLSSWQLKYADGIMTTRPTKNLYNLSTTLPRIDQ